MAKNLKYNRWMKYVLDSVHAIGTIIYVLIKRNCLPITFCYKRQIQVYSVIDRMLLILYTASSEYI